MCVCQNGLGGEMHDTSVVQSDASMASCYLPCYLMSVALNDTGLSSGGGRNCCFLPSVFESTVLLTSMCEVKC